MQQRLLASGLRRDAFALPSACERQSGAAGSGDAWPDAGPRAAVLPGHPLCGARRGVWVQPAELPSRGTPGGTAARHGRWCALVPEPKIAGDARLPRRGSGDVTRRQSPAAPKSGAEEWERASPSIPPRASLPEQSIPPRASPGERAVAGCWRMFGEKGGPPPPPRRAGGEVLGQPKPRICSFGNPQPAVLQEGKGREVVRGAAAEPRAASPTPTHPPSPVISMFWGCREP